MMKQWILLENGEEIKRAYFPDGYTWVGREVAEGLEWLPIEFTDKPAWDEFKQKVVRSEGRDGNRWLISYTAVSLPQETIDKIEADKQKEIERQYALKSWDNQYILLARSLGLPDKATTQEIQAKLEADEAAADAENNNKAARAAIKNAVKFLGIMNAITQSGGKHEGIKWHEDV